MKLFDVGARNDLFNVWQPAASKERRGTRREEATEEREAEVNVPRFPRESNKRRVEQTRSAVIPLHREFVTRVSRWFMVISSLRETFPFPAIGTRVFLATHSYIGYPRSQPRQRLRLPRKVIPYQPGSFLSTRKLR